MLAKSLRVGIALGVLGIVLWVAVSIVGDALDLPFAGRVGVAAKAGAMPKAGTPGSVSPSIVRSTNSFSLNLFRVMDAKAEGAGVVTSPMSAAIALAMASQGATGTCEQEMASVLGVRKLGQDAARQAYADLIADLRRKRIDTTFELANALWLQKGVDFKDAFVDADKTYFAAELRNVDLGSPGAVGDVNGWVKDATHGRIGKLVETMPDQAVAVLLDAVYFKGRWEDEFSKSQTTDRKFTLAGGKAVSVPTMQRGSRAEGEPMEYFENRSFQAVRLPYKHEEAAMWVILPKPGVAFGVIERSMSGESWASWDKAFKSRPGHLLLPRFSVETRGSLKPHLTSLGMKRAFSSQDADFSAMTGEKVWLSDVVQAAEVTTDEEGTVASAATIVGATAGAYDGPAASQPFEMNVNRPFLFAITDKNGLILFLGSVKDPR